MLLYKMILTFVLLEVTKATLYQIKPLESELEMDNRQMVKAAGYPLMSYSVTTADGYKL